MNEQDLNEYNSLTRGLQMTSLDEDLSTHAILLEQAGHLSADLREISETAKDRVKTVMAETYLNLKQKFLEDGIKITEAALSNHVLVDRCFIRAQEGAASCRKDSDQAYSLYEAFRARGPMVTALGRAASDRIVASRHETV